MRRLIISILALLSVATLSAQGGDDRFRLQVQADLGTIFLDGAGGPTVTLGVGVRMFDHLYVGAETGFDTMIKRYKLGALQYSRFEGYVPLGVNLKGYLFKDSNLILSYNTDNSFHQNQLLFLYCSTNFKNCNLKAKESC